MGIHRTIAIVAAVVLGCALATTAGARFSGNSAVYADPAGDAPSAPDITSVSVSNDDRGDVSFRIALGNRPAASAQDWVALFLDVDDVADADGTLAAEYLLLADAGGGHFLRLGDVDPQELPAFLLSGFASSFAGGVLSLRVNQRDLRDTSKLNLWLRAGTEGDESVDDAPDGDGVWEYGVVSPTLYVLSFSPPKSARVGEVVRGSMIVRGASRGAGRIGCTATLGGRRLAGKGDWFTLSLAGGGTVETLKADPRCAWTIPRSARGKLMRGTITLTQSGLQVSRSFSVRVR